MTAAQAVSSAAERLRAAGCASPRREAEYLLCTALGTERAGIYVLGRSGIPGEALDRFEALVARRVAREPLQHITGCTEFYGLGFSVSRKALVPRPETEVLLEEFMEALPPDPQLLLDVGTGSGILAVCLALRYPGATVVASDVSTEALALAVGNARMHAAGILPVGSDLLEALDARFDGVVANLPYIPEKDIPKAQPEVRLHDPRIALDGGLDGMKLLRRLVADAPRCMAPGGILALEASGRQPWRITRLLEKAGTWKDIRKGCDLAGKPRWVTARLS